MTTPKMHGRQPADQAGDPRQAIWTAIRGFAAPFDLSAIVDATEVNRSTAYDYLKGLTQAGHLEYTAAPPGQAGQWTLVRDTGFHAPRLTRDGRPVTVGAGLQNMWRSMRGLSEFSPRDLSAHSTTPDVSVTEATAKTYCAMLLRCGYLRVVRKANPAQGRQAVYRLIRNTGPRPPQIQRVKQVYDPNTNRVHLPGGAA